MNSKFDVLVRPLVTEKSNYQSGRLKQYAFVVADEATRTMVKDAVETIYKVDVLRVNVINAPAKRGRRRNRRLLVRRAAFKKAIVTLVEGQDLNEIFGGVQ